MDKDYTFEKDVYRYKCKLCRNVFCMPNCRTCPMCLNSPAQENSICYACLEKYGENFKVVGDAADLVKPGDFAAIGHDQVLHSCPKDNEYHVWQRGGHAH